MPHSISVVLGELLKPIEDAFGVVSATAFVLRPAADFGQEGVEELRDQTVGLLRFEKPPASVFGRQLAFNVIPQHLIPGAGEALVRRVEGEVADLLRWNERRLAIQLAAVPVFYGHTAAVRLRLRGEASLPQVTAALAPRAPGPRPVGKGAPGTPMEAAAGPAATLSHVSEDGASGFWVWLIAGEAAAASARAAVDLAAALAEI